MFFPSPRYGILSLCLAISGFLPHSFPFRKDCRISSPVLYAPILDNLPFLSILVYFLLFSAGRASFLYNISCPLERPLHISGKRRNWHMENLIFLIRSLGISGTYLGYYYLCTAVKLVLEDPGCLLMISKILYPKIALIHHTTPACVERDIRTVINLCWTRGDRDRLCQIAGCRLQRKPTNGEFIDLLVTYCRKYQSEQT